MASDADAEIPVLTDQAGLEVFYASGVVDGRSGEDYILIRAMANAKEFAPAS